MHYADGTKAHKGDIVIGKGYNLKDNEGNLKTIVGEVVGLVHDSDACNIRVLVLQSRTEPHGYVARASEHVYTHNYGEPVVVASTVLEYGETRQFSLLIPAPGHAANGRPSNHAMIDGFPRRNRTDHYTLAEQAISEAVSEVEQVGAGTEQGRGFCRTREVGRCRLNSAYTGMKAAGI